MAKSFGIDWSKVHQATIKNEAKIFADSRLYRSPKSGRARRRKDLIEAYTRGAQLWAASYEHQVQMRIQDQKDREQNMMNLVKC